MSCELTPKQLTGMDVLGSPALHNLLEGGSRSGKTFLIVRAIAIRAIGCPGSRHAAFRFRFNHAKASLVHDTWPKVMRECFPDVPWHMNKEDWFAELPGESQVWFAGLDDKERVEKVLGNEYASIFLNECSQIPYGSRNIALTRLAQRCDYERDGVKHQLRLKAFYDYNPPSKAHWGYKLFHEKRDPETNKPLKNPNDYASLQMNPQDNRQNVAPEYLQMLQNLPARLKSRFFDGSYADATPNALWTEDVLEQARVDEMPEIQRIAVGVDPSGASDEDNGRNDEIGVVIVGLGTDGVGYVLEDCTLKAGPSGWGSAAVSAYDRHDADAIVVETNYGGEMAKAVIEAAAEKEAREGRRDGMRKPTVKKVTASRGKAIRAEPISTLFETGKAKLVGEFRELETELCAFSTGGYTGEGSPNRADAMVWAFTELFPGMVRKPSDGRVPQVIVGRPHVPPGYHGRVPQVVTGRNPLSRSR